MFLYGTGSRTTLAERGHRCLELRQSLHGRYRYHQRSGLLQCGTILQHYHWLVPVLFFPELPESFTLGSLPEGGRTKQHLHYSARMSGIVYFVKVLTFCAHIKIKLCNITP